MTGTADKMRCMMGCWAMGALAGTLAVVLLVLLGGMSWTGAIFTGGVLGVVVALVMTLVLCPALPTPAEARANLEALQARKATSMGSGGAPAAAAPAAAAVTAAPVAAPAVAAATAAPVAAPVAAAAPVVAAPVAAPEPIPEPAPAPTPVPTPAPVAAPAAEAGPGVKPVLLTEARAGGPDNLKEIKGVGPKMEGMLHGMGIYHFDQVASWSADEVAWVDDNLQGFKGRVSRDNWVDQAKLLAAGGETEFSKKVEDGDVY